MVKDFESLGVSAIAVHGRTKSQWSGDPVNKGMSGSFKSSTLKFNWK